MLSRLLLPLFLILISSLSAGAETRIGSWNIRNLGWDNGKDYAALAEVGSRFDLIAVQEVMSEEGIDRFELGLEARTGVNWDRLCSHLVGRGSYQEMYCFVWRQDRVGWVDGATVYIDDRDLFAREPFSAVFETVDGVRFMAATLHAIYGEEVAGREAEARALRSYHDWLHLSFPGVPVFLMGDFNLPPTNAAWSTLGETAYPLIQEGATTLSSVDGRFANLYDNIWVDAGVDLPITGYGRVEFPHQILGITHEAARDRVSDHIPVYISLEAGAGVRFDPHLGRNGFVSPAAETGNDHQSGLSQTEPVIGNARSKIYHLPGCPSYGQVGASNRRAFRDTSEAEAAGYRRAKNCEP